MDDRAIPAGGAEHLPPTGRPTFAGEPAAGGLEDPRVLQILTTEHWSLLSARSLVYNEAFARAGMFLTFVSASFVALALAANAMAFSSDFLLLAAGLLALDLLIGLATVGRIMDATLDDLRAVHGMNRIRNAYAQIAPEVLPYFVTSIHDDAAGVMATYGEPAAARGVLQAFLHGLTTTNSMVALINAVMAGSIAGLLAILAGTGPLVATVATIAIFVAFFATESRYELAIVRRFEAGLEARFPTPR